MSSTTNDPICECGCPLSNHSDGQPSFCYCYTHADCLEFHPLKIVSEQVRRVLGNCIQPEKVDLVVEAVREDLLQRSKHGIKKYNTTLYNSKLTFEQFLQHHYEELLDAANYVKAELMKLRGELP